MAFRRWRRPTVRAGGTLHTPMGLLAIDAVDRVDPGAIGDADARRAGHADAAAVRAALRGDGRDLPDRVPPRRPRPAHRPARRRGPGRRRPRRDRGAARALRRGEPPRPLDGGDAAGDRRRPGHAGRRPRRAARPARAAAVQDRRAQAQGARPDREPGGRLPPLAPRPGVPGRLAQEPVEPLGRALAAGERRDEREPEIALAGRARSRSRGRARCPRAAARPPAPRPAGPRRARGRTWRRRRRCAGRAPRAPASSTSRLAR